MLQILLNQVLILSQMLFHAILHLWLDVDY